MTDASDLPVVVVGFGGHGRVVADALRTSGRTIAAATDLHPDPTLSGKLGVDIITDDEMCERFDASSVELALGIGSIWPGTEDSTRCRVARTLTGLGYRFTGFRHPAAWVSAMAAIDTTAQIHAGAVVQTGATIGEHVIVNTRASVDHDCRVEAFAHIGPAVTLSGDVCVGRGSHLGTGSCVIQGVTLGPACFVAAGATVVSDVPAGQYVRGTPARAFQPSGPHAARFGGA
ncbi:MAG: NeuD/PglB/VioB family sugar acetyltransferase [Planctomycetaceae bacterium]